MNITFFEIEDWEKQFFSQHLKDASVRFVDEPLTAQNAGQAGDTEILSVFIYSDVDKPVLDRLPNLKFIATRSTGVDHIDIDECRRRKILVSNVPTYGENTVGEHTFALILSLSRNLSKACVKRLTGDFSTHGLKGFDLKGKTLGVIGTGNIGSHVIRIAGGFGMNVLAFDPKPNQFLSELIGFSYVDLDSLLAGSDIVTLHVPLNKHTHHLINRDTISKMKDGAYLINTSRGAVVDTGALIEALDRKKLAGAGLDVIEGEELIKEEEQLLYDENKMDLLANIARGHILLRKDNVVYTPHIGFLSQEALMKIQERTLGNIQGFLSGNPQNEVTGAGAERVPVKVG